MNTVYDRVNILYSSTFSYLLTNLMKIYIDSFWGKKKKNTLILGMGFLKFETMERESETSMEHKLCIGRIKETYK